MAIAALKLKQREIGPHKAIVAPLLSARTVLSNSPWTFVALWLRRNRKHRALFLLGTGTRISQGVCRPTAAFGAPTSLLLLHECD